MSKSVNKRENAVKSRENRISSYTKTHQKKESIGYTGIKVTVYIPNEVPNRQRKINTIYDILKPCEH